MYFGVGSAGFPNQLPRGSNQFPELEKKLIEFVKTIGNEPFSAILINRYDVGDKMLAHQDTNQPGYPYQKICIFGDFEGGELIIGDYSLGNGLYTFDASIMHGVNPVTSGTRFSVVTYMKGINDNVSVETMSRLREAGYIIPSREEA